MAMMPNELILASASSARARLLQNAGVAFRVQAANIDESAVKQMARDQGWTAGTCALALAEAKARRV